MDSQHLMQQVWFVNIGSKRCGGLIQISVGLGQFCMTVVLETTKGASGGSEGDIDKFCETE